MDETRSPDPELEIRVERIRVSCAGLCRIQDEHGRYLLALNTNRLSKGLRIFMPLGGGFIYEDEALLERFDAIPELPNTHELRLYIPPARLNDFRTWFLSRRDREIDPLRELVEELVDELRALPQLDLSDVAFERRFIHDSERITDRTGVEGEKTQYWLEIFDVTITTPALWQTLLDAPTDGGLRWVTPEAIRAGQTPDGESVEARTILEQS
ncbi:MAG: hypothetical protein SGI73_18800 [Chloroflexota bacterium]|nr:hypothetical protein [Chloroflexota bacterium]